MPDLFARAKLAVRWSNITLNTDRRMVNGWVDAVYDGVNGQIASSDGTGRKGDPRLVDHVVDFVIPPLEDEEVGHVQIDSLDNGKYRITFTDDEGNTHTVDVDKVPALIQDAMGSVYEVAKNSNGEEGTLVDVSATSGNAAEVIKKYPCHIGYALNHENKIYLCDKQNVADKELLLKAIMQKRNIAEGALSCELSVRDSVLISWYNAIQADSLNRIPNGATFTLRLNGKEVSGATIRQEDLSDSLNICELVMEKGNVRKVLATYRLQKYVKPPAEALVMEIERNVTPQNRRKDFYLNKAIAGSKQGEEPFSANENIRLRMLKVRTNVDTTLYSDKQTSWCINDEVKHTGEYLDYVIPQGANPKVKAVAGADTVWVELNVAQRAIADGTVSLNYSAVSSSRSDTVNAIRYYNVSLPRCKTGDVGNFIKNSPKPIVVRVERRAAVNNIIYQGEASDGAVMQPALYNGLFLKNIVKDADGAISNARLVSVMNQEDISNLEESIEDGRPTQKTEVLLMRIARLSQANADTLSSMIKQRRSNPKFSDTLTYELTDADDISKWMTFHNGLTIDIMVNLENLGNDPQANTPQKDFTRLMAHELLHHWWTHFKPFEKLKWKVIIDKQPTYSYRLSDGLSSGNSQDSNQGCSMGAGHERHNPEHSKVCNEQYNY